MSSDKQLIVPINPDAIGCVRNCIPSQNIHAMGCTHNQPKSSKRSVKKGGKSRKSKTRKHKSRKSKSRKSKSRKH